MDRGDLTDQGNKPKKPSLFKRIFASCIPSDENHHDPTKRYKTPVPIIKTPSHPVGPPLGPHAPPPGHGGGPGPNPIPNPNPPPNSGPPIGGGGPGPNPIPNPEVPPKNPPVGGGGPGPNPIPNPTNPPKTGPIGGGGPGPNPFPIPPTSSTGALVTGAPMTVPMPVIDPVSNEDGQHSGVGGDTGAHSHDQPTSIAGPASSSTHGGHAHSGLAPALPTQMTNAGMHTSGHGHAGDSSGSHATGYGGNSGFGGDGGGASSSSGGGGGFGGASGI